MTDTDSARRRRAGANYKRHVAEPTLRQAHEALCQILRDINDWTGFDLMGVTDTAELLVESYNDAARRRHIRKAGVDSSGRAGNPK